MNGSSMEMASPQEEGKIDTDRAYEKLKGLVYRLTHDFQGQFGGDFDELLSEANWIFLKAVRDYDPFHGAKLITYVYTKVYYGLRSTLGPNHYVRYGPRTLQRKHTPITHVAASPKTSLGEKLNRLSEEAAAVVRIALFIREKTSSSKRTRLIEILCEYGWAAEEILDCFNEIKEIL